uniref:Uncharacterized protein n=1 Tax=Trichobilharzia regenti TaxID=157069 RepID=A0AA85K690_TRIRE|nr:unnamed protein product [Trichobilharzia regenti]
MQRAPYYRLMLQRMKTAPVCSVRHRSRFQRKSPSEEYHILSKSRLGLIFRVLCKYSFTMKKLFNILHLP